MRLSVRAELRRRAGLTQHALNKRTGISDTRISLWENGQIELPADDVDKIALAIEQELARVPVELTRSGILRALTLGLGDGGEIRNQKSEGRVRSAASI